MDQNTAFCRILYERALGDMRHNEALDFKKNASAIRMSTYGTNTWYLVEWLNMDKDGGTFHFEVEAGNANHAKAQAVNNWLEHHAEAVRQRRELK